MQEFSCPIWKTGVTVVIAPGLDDRRDCTACELTNSQRLGEIGSNRKSGKRRYDAVSHCCSSRNTKYHRAAQPIKSFPVLGAFKSDFG
jgi:hypothetical protein